MQVEFLVQPFDRTGCYSPLGEFLAQLLRQRSPVFFSRIWFVSAFANLRALVRISDAIRKSIQDGAEVYWVIGIDHCSTTVEALQEILQLGVRATIVKNVKPGHTFHPKLYLFEAPGRQAKLILGSSNLTEGGMYRNYEGNVCITYDLVTEADQYWAAINALERFLRPQGSIAQLLTPQLIKCLADRGEIVSEFGRQTLVRQLERVVTQSGRPVAHSPFGFELVPVPPPLPEAFVRRVLSDAASQRRRLLRPAAAVSQTSPQLLVQINAFYMHLNKLQGPNIPGEGRIPIAARDVATEFWGWPDQYNTEYRQRGKKRRQYKTWKPTWRIIDLSQPEISYLDEVRMYEYEDSADFRFYSSRLVALGADEFDIIRLTRCPPGDEAVFQCELARQGTLIHQQWDSYCTQQVKGQSRRRFGFA